MVVAIPVSEGDEVAEGDVVAVVESMKMETSLTAPFAGRVRRVLTGTNVQVPAHTPLLQLEAIEDEAAEQSAERVEFAAEPLEAGDPRAAALDRLRWMLLGYDVSGDEVRRALAALREAEHDAELLAGEHRLLDVFTDVRALSRARTRPGARAAAQPAGVPARVPALARREGRAAARALRQRCSQRALSHYGVESLDRTPALEEACYRLFVSQERADLARAAVMAILDAPAGARRRARRPLSATSSAACSTGSSWPPSAATR